MTAPVHYANLTSGAELSPIGARVVRIQSSHLEAFALWNVVADLDYGFLFDAAFRGVILHDCGSRRGAVSRAQWQGVPWILWAYERARARCERDAIAQPVLINGVNVAHDFLRVFNRSHRFRDPGLNKLRYVADLTGRGLSIECISGRSTMDGDRRALARCIETILRPQLREAA